MKKIIILFVALALIGLSSCKKDKVKALTPISEDTAALTNYEFMDTNESDVDTIVTKQQTVENNDIVTEDTVGNVRPATPKEVKNADYIYVIVGSYIKTENAKNRCEHFKQLGFKAEILPKYGNYNRVAIAKFVSETDARKKLKEYRKKFNDNSYWLLIR